MSDINISMKLSPASIVMMDEFAKTFSAKVQKRVFKRAGVKASEAMVAKIKGLMPYNKKPKYSRPHMRDVVAFKVKAYKQSGRTLFITGYKSKTTNLQTLVEKGNFLTSPRKTRHESNSGRVAKHAGSALMPVPKQRRDGSWRTVREMIRKRDNKRSTGSRYVGTGRAMSRGDFPKSKKPFAPITTAAKAMQNQIMDIMETEIAAGFKRAFAKEAGSFGD